MQPEERALNLSEIWCGFSALDRDHTQLGASRSDLNPARDASFYITIFLNSAYGCLQYKSFICITQDSRYLEE
jgi:hypothetical protein